MHNQKLFKEAAESYRQALKLDPNNAVFWSNLGATLLDGKNYSESLEAGEKALGLAEPNSPLYQKAAIRKAKALVGLEKGQEAKTFLNTLIASGGTEKTISDAKELLKTL